MKLAIWTAAVAAMVGVAFAQVSTTPTPPPPAPPNADVISLLPALVEHSRHTARIENGRLTGEGADFLRALGAESQFVLIGEDHGNQGIADFVSAYWSDLHASGFNYAAVEIDPWTAGALEREVRAGGVPQWTQFVAGHGGATMAPFFTWESEARLAQNILSSTPRGREPTIWGLDQVFIGGAPWMLRDIAERAHGRDARTRAAALADAAAGDDSGGLHWLGRAEAQPLIDLRAALNGRQDREFAALVDAMIVSQRIYRPFTADQGEALFANIERETLMKRTFLERYNAALRADRRPPRVMLKFGSYHMFRGASPTHVQALGGFVSELATQNGRNALAIMPLCGPGGFVGTFDIPEVACDAPFAESYGFLAPYVDAQALTIFDLREWRLRPRRWEHLPVEIRQAIESYDLLVVVPNGAGARFLPGLPTPNLGHH
jgi:hypothetical protein